MITNEIVYMLGFITRKQWASALRWKSGLNKEIFCELIRKVEKAYRIKLMSDIEKIVAERDAQKEMVEKKWKK